MALRAAYLLAFLVTFTLTRKSDAFTSSLPKDAVLPTTASTDTDIKSLTSLDDTSPFGDNLRMNEVAASRRGFFKSISALALPLVFSRASFAEEEQQAPRKTKILVLGGTGFVGAQVVATLNSLAIDTVITSRNGREGTIALDFTKDNVEAKIERLAAGCSAVISCVGAIGTEDDEKINAGTGFAAKAAKAAGVSRFVYITVAPEVREFARDIDFLSGYLAGKEFSRDAVVSAFDQDAVLIEPSFIYGGGSFEINPPRVASFYGQFIEGLLSSNPIRSIERILSPGLIKIALEPPVPVEAVANAAVAGALGKTISVLDTYDKIKEASQLI